MIVHSDIKKMLRDKGLTIYEIKKRKLLSGSVLSGLNTDQPLTEATIDKLCKLLTCQPGDLMHYEDK